MGRPIECKVFVVSVDGNNVRGGQKDVSPGVESMNNREEFLVMDVVVSFHLVEGMRYTPYGSKLASVILLRENGPCSKLRRIYFQEKGAFVVQSL